MVQGKERKDLNRYDELSRRLKNKNMAAGFEMLPCFFPPTFKVERQDGFMYKEQRRPSYEYTDQIHWKNGDQLDERVAPTALDHWALYD